MTSHLIIPLTCICRRQNPPVKPANPNVLLFELLFPVSDSTKSLPDYSSSAMEFWGIEVKAGEPVKCDPGLDKYVHLSQASLGDVKEKGNDLILISVNVNGQKIVLGTLSPEKYTQISFDLVFEKEFELSHNWKNGSVYFCGYKTMMVDEESDGFMDNDSDSDQETPFEMWMNAKAKHEPSASKPKANIDKQIKVEMPNEEEDEDDEDESEEEDSDDAEDMVNAGDSDDEDDEESSEEDEDTRKKAEVVKKRTVESTPKTAVPGKKAKLVTPAGEKTGADGKKGGKAKPETPAKQAGKTPASTDKKLQASKSGGQVSCRSCSKTFNSDSALVAHTKAKHGGGK